MNLANVFLVQLPYYYYYYYYYYYSCYLWYGGLLCGRKPSHFKKNLPSPCSRQLLQNVCTVLYTVTYFREWQYWFKHLSYYTVPSGNYLPKFRWGVISPKRRQAITIRHVETSQNTGNSPPLFDPQIISSDSSCRSRSQRKTHWWNRRIAPTELGQYHSSAWRRCNWDGQRSLTIWSRAIPPLVRRDGWPPVSRCRNFLWNNSNSLLF